MIQHSYYSTAKKNLVLPAYSRDMVQAGSSEECVVEVNHTGIGHGPGPMDNFADEVRM